MMRPQFQPSQVREIAQAFEEHGVDYLFIGKGGAILLGFPTMTQDIDVFPERSEENGARIVAALRKIGFELDTELVDAIRSGKDFVQIKSGPFDVNLVFAPDGISSFAEATDGRVDVFHILNIYQDFDKLFTHGCERPLSPKLPALCLDFRSGGS